MQADTAHAYYCSNHFLVVQYYHALSIVLHESVLYGTHLPQAKVGIRGEVYSFPMGRAVFEP